jgi:hypothetical protein
LGISEIGVKQPRRAFFFDLGSENWGLGETGIPFNRSRNGIFFAISDMAGRMEQDIKALVCCLKPSTKQRTRPRQKTNTKAPDKKKRKKRPRQKSQTKDLDKSPRQKTQTKHPDKRLRPPKTKAKDPDERPRQKTQKKERARQKTMTKEDQDKRLLQRFTVLALSSLSIT